MESHGLLVLKGRTEGDTQGKYSFISKSGKSTIDLAWGSINYIENITKFEIYHTINKNDHGICTIKFENPLNNYLFNTNKDSTVNSVPSYFCNFKFNINTIGAYQSYLTNSANLYFSDNNVDKLNDNLIKTIKESA